MTSEIPEGASVPALGLSNKAVFQGQKQTQESLYENSDIQPVRNEQYTELYFSPLSLKGKVCKGKLCL